MWRDFNPTPDQWQRCMLGAVCLRKRSLTEQGSEDTAPGRRYHSLGDSNISPGRSRACHLAVCILFFDLYSAMLLSHVCIPGTISAWNERWTSRIPGREAGHSNDHKGNNVVKKFSNVECDSCRRLRVGRSMTGWWDAITKLLIVATKNCSSS
jgi:hypothetical protein